ncbi:MAG: L,D-transpeptidase family protein [Pseudobdellovibrio sp.]
MYNFLSFLFIFTTGVLSHAEEPVKYPIQIINLSSDERIATNALLADKAKRQLSLMDAESLSKGTVKVQYSIDIGKKTGEKKKRDDRRTPEGIYILQQKKMPPEIPFDTYGSMAFTTNYPNYFDKYENKTGSGIWLHSVPDKVPLTRGSRGCVVLRNDDIKKIESSILLNKTFLVIDNEVDWVSKAEYDKEKAFATSWTDQWRSTWEKQDLEAYINNYSDRFSSPPFNKTTWLAHKQKLKDRYTYVKVSVSEPNILQTRKQYIVQFVQSYESDQHKDVGIKTLYLLKEGNSLKIQREDWAALK